MDPAVKPGNRIVALVITVDKLFHLFCMTVVADKECIRCINDNEIMDPNQTYMFTGGMHKIILSGKIFRLANITLIVMHFDVVEGFECAKITPLGFKSNDCDPF